MKKILIIVPHQDDELNLTAGILKQLLDLPCECSVIFVTNGDYYPETVRKRAADTKKNIKLLGFRRAFFLGYGDTLTGDHVYHTEGPAAVRSKAGRTETYGVPPFTDYRYEKSGTHSPYTRESLKQDLRDAIREADPDTVLYVDCDGHPDHRCTSLLCDEVFRELYLQTGRAPVLLKRFAYCGGWFGKPDYFAERVLPTDFYDVHADNDENNCFPYCLEERVAFRSDPEILRMDLGRSLLYRSMIRYGTEDALEHFEGLANADTVFWYRDLKNAALGAAVTVSSGDPAPLNDFKLLDYDDVTDISGKTAGMAGFWRPDPEDSAPEILFRFGGPLRIAELRIHQGAPGMGRIRKILLDWGTASREVLLDGAFLQVLPLDTETEGELRIRLLEFDPDCGIREIEVYDHRPVYDPGTLGLPLYNGEEVPVSAGKRTFAKLRYRSRVLTHRFLRKVHRKLRRIFREVPGKKNT